MEDKELKEDLLDEVLSVCELVLLNNVLEEILDREDLEVVEDIELTEELLDLDDDELIFFILL